MIPCRRGLKFVNRIGRFIVFGGWVCLPVLVSHSICRGGVPVIASALTGWNTDGCATSIVLQWANLWNWPEQTHSIPERRSHVWVRCQAYKMNISVWPGVAAENPPVVILRPPKQTQGDYLDYTMTTSFPIHHSSIHDIAYKLATDSVVK